MLSLHEYIFGRFQMTIFFIVQAMFLIVHYGIFCRIYQHSMQRLTTIFMESLMLIHIVLITLMNSNQSPQ